MLLRTLIPKRQRIRGRELKYDLYSSPYEFKRDGTGGANNMHRRVEDAHKILVGGRTMKRHA
jgi:hypothetical protein